MNLLRIGALIGALMLQGCDPATLALMGATISGINGGFQLADRVAASDASAVTVICQRWAVDRARGQQRIADDKIPPVQASNINDLAPWLDGACNPAAPPSGDALGAVAWIAGLIVEHNRLAGLTK